MRIVEVYSHLNGQEYLLVHHPDHREEIKDVISGVDSDACKIKVSKEKGKVGTLLYSPDEMNKLMKAGFAKRDWKESRTTYWVTSDRQLIRETLMLPADEQKKVIEAAGAEALRSFNQTDFVKDRIAVEVQFGKYFAVAYDLFVKHMAFYVGNVIDVGVEIVPMKELFSEMSSGVAYYERELYHVLRQGRAVPAVPLVLIGVAP